MHKPDSERGVDRLRYQREVVAALFGKGILGAESRLPVHDGSTLLRWKRLMNVIDR